jgi:hypothetical protein
MAKSRYSLHIRTLYVPFTVTIYFVQVDNTSECISKLRTRERGVDVIPNTSVDFDSSGIDSESILSESISNRKNRFLSIQNRLFS